MTDHKLAERAAILGEKMLVQLNESLAGLDGVREIRGRGLMLGVELTKDCGTVVEIALRNRLLVNVTAGNVVRLLPPLISSDAEAEQMIGLTCNAIKEFLAGEAA